MGVSVAALREQVEVAKALGFIDVRPRTGIRRLPYSFFPAAWQSLSYAIETDPACFKAFAELRDQIERAYWHRAVESLQAEDYDELDGLVQRAWEKLHGTPVQIPYDEHRHLHLAIFQRLKNPFVLGLLEAFWQAYQAVGLSVYSDYQHLTEVWNYHQRMVEAIRQGDVETGFQLLVAHQDLLFRLPVPGAGT
jgi:DNA-binding FadR family transcriptional regulator